VVLPALQRSPQHPAAVRTPCPPTAWLPVDLRGRQLKHAGFCTCSISRFFTNGAARQGPASASVNPSSACSTQGMVQAITYKEPADRQNTWPRPMWAIRRSPRSRLMASARHLFEKSPSRSPTAFDPAVVIEPLRADTGPDVHPFKRHRKKIWSGMTPMWKGSSRFLQRLWPAGGTAVTRGLRLPSTPGSRRQRPKHPAEKDCAGPPPGHRGDRRRSGPRPTTKFIHRRLGADEYSANVPWRPSWRRRLELWRSSLERPGEIPAGPLRSPTWPRSCATAGWEWQRAPPALPVGRIHRPESRTTCNC